jgi:diguanylate cyclase (GGDEF)-like protein
LRLGARAGWGRQREGRVQFEKAFHTFVKVLGTVGSRTEVEAVLLEMVRRIAQNSEVQVELISLRDMDRDQERERPASQEGDRHSRDSVQTFLLRYGSVVHGRLQLRSSARPGSALGPEAIQRLTTVCTVAASSLENLRQANAMWDGPAEEQHPDEWLGTVSPQALTRAARRSFITAVRDATFLNAVFPFAISQSRRYREPLSLLCMEIDCLGAIRELLGDDVADRLVGQVGETTASLVRTSDIVVRLDDDRLVVLLFRARGGNAERVARMICRSIAETTLTAFEVPAVTVSIGVAEFPTSAQNALTLLDAADEALGQAQTLGRNQAVLAAARPELASRLASPCLP